MIRFIFSAVFIALSTFGCFAQDSIWVKYDDRFKDNRFLVDASMADSIEFRAKGTTPVIRLHGDAYANGYSDTRVTGIVGAKAAVVIGDPGRILWKPTTSDADFNNDYMVDTNRWCFKHSKESDHFVVFWDKTFGEISSVGKVTGSVSKLTVDINDLLTKAEGFYKTNVEKIHMCVTGQGKSQTDHYKMIIYLLDQTEWNATGSGSDNKIGTLWLSPNTCQPVGSTVAHEIGHSFQYQTYCDNILRGKANDNHSGFRYGYPNSNGGCGFWEQCAQWQAHQDYPSEAINSYHFSVWIQNCHRHFEHEWMRYASYWEQYFWTEKQGMDALGRIWNESAYPEDANQAYMRIYLNGDYSALRSQLFEYAQKTATFDYDAVRNYVSSSAWGSYATKFYDADGWQQISYQQCPQPTGFNVIPMTSTVAGKKYNVTLRALPVGSALATGDPGTQVDGDGNASGKVSAYNSSAAAGNEGLAFGFVTIKTDGTREYGPMTLASSEADATSSYTIPEKAKKVFLVVQGSPDKYFQCPWDDKETTDVQLPYKLRIE